ncbi:MarR family transcriptional regulator [Erythrobacter sp. HA6-11]
MPRARERRDNTDDSAARDASSQELPNRDDLMRLSEQLQALAGELQSAQQAGKTSSLSSETGPTLSEKEADLPSLSGESRKPGDEQSQFLTLARARYDARRKRASVFDNEELFGEPAWDILLDLYIAHAEGKPVSVSSACIGSASPPTTGLRWLGVLQAAGLLEREHDMRDQRRVLVRLSNHGVQRMETYFRDALGQALRLP